jgi:MOSC domain-containing protein YiiM
MQLISINIGKAQAIEGAKKSGMTGIYKKATDQPISIHPLGLEGDAIVDVENHGGVDQAVYIYGTPDYAWWAEQLGHELEPGTFGENLTITGLESTNLNVGDIIRIGEVTLQITSPRIPCSTIAARMGDPQFVKKFRHAERPGVYCRVLQTGTICTGDSVALEPYTGNTLSVIEMFRLFYEGANSEADLRRQLAAPIDIRSRRDIEEQLAKYQAQ